jgi:hypothetical protein
MEFTMSYGVGDAVMDMGELETGDDADDDSKATSGSCRFMVESFSYYSRSINYFCLFLFLSYEIVILLQGREIRVFIKFISVNQIILVTA